MANDPSGSQNLQIKPVWDSTTRWFHWINVMCIIGLVGVGVVILNNKVLGVSADGKVLLKTVHVYIGYVFTANLVWRLFWAFKGNKFARWKSFLPLGRGYRDALRQYVDGSRSGNPPQYLGHNPVAKLMVTLLFLLLTVQAVSGLVLAGTDLYFPPFGAEIEQWVDATPDDGVALKPGSKEGTDPQAYADMREFRSPFMAAHYYTFYIMLFAVLVHIASIVMTEIREKNGLVSAMFTGSKVISKKALDED
ncbi:MAG: cytochrome b/b6 domain-containing protein [Halieaceae bacterium]|jgi:Ni/Fe-hydrogenase 1 B-type cytochrome subunit|nr:cytochrome b/b6 domain-containing protein [Halieaceae bacterium]